MSPPRISHGALVPFLIAVALLGPAASAAKWRILTSDHFEAITVGDEANAKMALERIERYRAAMSLWPQGRRFENLPTRVYILSKERELERIRPRRPDRSTIEVSGLYLGTPFENCIAVDGTLDWKTHGHITYHELTHLLLSGEPYPIWLAEGLAECFATLKFTGSKVIFGEPPALRVTWLERPKELSLETLTGLTPENRAELKPNDIGSFYAQSWLLTHFLIFGQREQEAFKFEKLDQFLSLLRQTGDALGSIAKVYGWDGPTLSSKLRSYGRAGRFNYLAAEMPPDFKVSIVSRAVQPGEPEAWLAHWLVLADYREDAAAQVERCRAVAPGSYHAKLSEGALMLLNEKFSEAADLFRQTAAERTEEFYPRFMLARALTRDGEGFDPLAANPMALAEAQATLVKAIALKPRYAPARHYLGALQARTPGQLREGLKNIQAALTLDPHDCSTRFSFAQALRQAGAEDQARKQAQLVVAQAKSEELVRHAQEFLAGADGSSPKQKAAAADR